jgi:glycosyltransferase involved in cell wall biosynthesis
LNARQPGIVRPSGNILRIAMVSTPFVAVPPHDYGGTELIVHELVEGLCAHGHSVTLFATGDSRTSGQLRFLYHKPHWPPDVLTDLNHVTWALRDIQRGRFDLVHAHSALALTTARLLGPIPMVYTVHHDRDDRLSEYYRFCADAHFIAISADQRRREQALARCTVIHHGVDTTRFQATMRPAGYLCYVGRLAQVKGPHTAIDVARAAGLPIRVAGAVHPVDQDFARRELDERLALPHVTYVGVVDQTQKIPLLRDARALLLPLEWNEPFGVIVIEAMLSGCPVVAFPRGSMRELVEPGVTGFLVETAESMAELVRPGGPLETFNRVRCRERAVRRFSRERMVRDHERLYGQVLDRAPDSRGRPGERPFPPIPPSRRRVHPDAYREVP